MPQQERLQWAKLRVGIMVIVALVVFAVGIFFISGQVGFFTRHYALKAYLSNAGDLRDGAQVRLAGITVGSVSKIGISPFPDPQRAVEVDLRIAATYQPQIRADSQASLETVGLLGDSYIDISRGTPDQPVLENDGTLRFKEKADVAKVMENTNDVVMNLNALSAKLNDITGQIESGKGSMGKLLYDEALYNKMYSVASGADKVMSQVQSGEGTMGKLISDDALYKRTVSTVDRLNQIMDDVQHGSGSLAKFINDPSAYNNLNRLLANGNTLIDNINQGQGSLGKLAKNDEFYNRMDSTLAHIDSITARVDRGEGTLGKISTDPSLFNNLSESSQSLKEFLTEFRKNPKKYLTVKLHIF